MTVKVDSGFKDIKAIKKELDTIPHLQIAYRGNELDKEYSNLDNRLTTLENDFSELRTSYISKKKIGWVIGLIWSVSTTIAALVLGILRLLKK